MTSYSKQSSCRIQAHPPYTQYSDDNEADAVITGGAGNPPNPPPQGPDITFEANIPISDGLRVMTYNCEVEFGFEMKEESIGYTPDIRRRIQTWVYHEYVEGGGEVSVMFSYPYQKFPLKGNPSANPQSWASHWDTDDNTNFDEDLTPSDADMIYSIDSLGTSGLYVPAGYVIGDKVRFCYRFVEWVEPTDGADTVPYTGDDESGVCKWHYILEAEVKFDPVTQDLYLHPILHSVGKKHPVYPEATSFND